MKHHFPVMASNTDKSVLVVNTLKDWMREAEKLAKKHSYEESGEFDRDKFIGDAFEHLGEAIIEWGRSDKAINLVEYSPAEEDTPGIDGIGLAHDLKSVHTVQFKYRGNTMTSLTEGKDHIAMFPAVSRTAYNAKYMTIITTAKDLHRVLDEAWVGAVKVLGFNELKKLIDGNKAFWQFYASDLLGRN